MADATPSGTTARRSWLDGLALYGHPRVVGMLFLGFSAGLPLILVFSTLSAWLRDVGISRTAIGFLSWVTLAYTFKVLWSPIVDHVRLPVLHAALGRRRSWMVLAIGGVAIGLIGMANTDPLQNIWQMAFFAVLVAFSSATQDIALDAYRIEAIGKEFQGHMSGAYQTGYTIGLKLIGGAGALYIADAYDWQTSYFVMAACMAIGFVTVLIVREPEGNAAREEAKSRPSATAGFSVERAFAWIADALVSPFLDFFRRNGSVALVILLFIGLFRLSDITLGVMANPFYIDMGFSKSDIATATKIVGIFAVVGGALLGGLLVVKWGILRALLFSAFALMATNFLFAWMAFIETDNFWVLTIAVSADSLAFGLSGSAFIAYLSSLTSVSYTATQYALFTSLMLLPGKFLAGYSGLIVDSAGYVVFFIYASCLALPAIGLVLLLIRLERRGLVERQESADITPQP